MKTVPISINIFKNSIWNLFLFASQGVMGLAGSILLARYLGPELMGEYSFVTWLIGIMGILIGIGFPNTVTKFIAELIGSRDKDSAQMLYARLLQVQFILVLLITIILMSMFYPKLSLEKREYYFFAFLSLIPLCMSTFLTAAFHGVQNFKVTSIIGSFINLFQLVLIILFIHLDLGLKGLIAIIFISGIIQTLMLWKCIGHTFYIPKSFKIPKELSNKVIRYTFNIYWVTALSMIVWQKSELFFLKVYSELEEIAYYSIAFNIAMIMTGFTALFSTVIFPVLSSYYGAGDREGIQNVYNKSIKAILIFYLPICIIVIVVAKPMVSVMYSSQFLAVSPLLIILMASSIFSAVGILFANLLLAVNRADIQAKYVSLIALTNIILDFILIPRYGATGAALANSSIRIMSFPIWMWIIKKQLGFHYPTRETFRCIVPNLPLAIILYFIGNHYPNILGIFLVLGIALFLYPFLLFIFKTITIDDARIIREILKTFPAPYEKIINVIFNKLPLRQDIP